MNFNSEFLLWEWLLLSSFSTCASSRISDLLSQLGSTEFKLLARKIYATYIISFVFAEAVSLFGFVLFVMRGDPEYYLALYLGGVVLMLLCFPRLPISE